MTDDQRNALLADAVALREQGHREQAQAALVRLVDQYPDDAEVAYQTAWVHDTLGLEAEAVPFYERALAGRLSDEDRHGAFLGLGSTYRALGRYGDAVATLRRGVAEFPDDGALRTFLAMALYNSGEARAAVEMLLKLLVATTRDEGVAHYRRAIELYAENLDATW